MCRAHLLERRSLRAADILNPETAPLARDRSGIDGIFRQDRPWVAVMAATTLVELVWWAVACSLGIAPVIRLPAYLGLAFTALGVAVALRLATGRAATAAPWPVAVAGTILVALGASAFLPLKYAIPREIPFWLDRPAALAERSLFGADPWLLLDSIAARAAVPMDWLYAAWLPTQLLLLFVLILARPSREKSQALIAYALVWFVLGAVAAVLLSSAGPIFYDRLHGGVMFAGLQHTLQDRGVWLAIAESDRMWRSYSSGQPGMVAGMSAFPSIHVAISLWLVLTARTIAPRLVPLAGVYFVLIWFGSVQLGWHYASDGLVGVIGTLALWRLSAGFCRA
jgi:hypothetical protein